MESSACRKILEAAIAAPSAENNAPYRLRWHNDAELQVWLDAGRSGKVSDRTFVLSDLAVGAAIESMVLQALALGYESKVQLFPQGAGAEARHAATIHFTALSNAMAPDSAELSLSAQIFERCTDRRFPFHGPVTPEEIAAIQSVLSDHQYQLDVFVTKESRAAAAWLIHAAEKIRFEDQRLHGELFDAVIFDRKPSPVGMNLDVIGVSPLETPFFSLMRKWSVLKALNLLGASWMLAYKSAVMPMLASPVAMLLSSAMTDRSGIIESGRQLQRVWLKCTELGFSVQLYAAPGILSLVRPVTATKHAKVISKITENLCQITGQNRVGLMFLRLGRMPDKPARSGRVSVEEIQAV